MPNPTIIKKTSQQLTITDDIKRLLQVVYYEQNQKEKSDDEVPTIKVSTVISKMAFYYEKIRNSVDYEEEHLLRKNAIERILKRRIIIEGVITVKEKELIAEDVAQHLLIELIRAGYLPNNKIPETMISEMGLILEKYFKLKKYALNESQENKEKGDFIRWIIAIAASEIEEKLGRSQADLVVVNYMQRILEANIKLPDNSPYDRDKAIQIYISIHRNYFKFDREMIGAILLKYYHPEWSRAEDNDIRAIADQLRKLRQRIDYQIDHPLSGQLKRIISRYTAFFTILCDVIKEDPAGVYDSFKGKTGAFAHRIKEVCRKKYRFSRRKLWRAGIRSIIYIFITKSIFAIMLEAPASKWFGEEINPLSLAINISFPAVLLFFIILFTRLPSSANSAKIVEGIEEVVFAEHERKDFFHLRPPVKRGRILNAFFGLFYVITSFLSFSLVVWGLNKIHFSWVSIVIFLFFLAFVSFFSIRIRKGAHELIITEPKENILNLFSDFFYVPIVSAGKWLSEKFSRINVFVFILDFIIEAPFKIFVEIAEEWTKYVRERKDEIV